MVTGLVYSKKYLEHNPGWGHPERPERLKAIVDGLKQAKLWASQNVRVVEPKPAKRADIELVHDSNYVSLVKKLSATQSPIDGDTPVRKNTFELALLAAGGATEAGRMVLSGKAQNAFALVRPPGHHASRARGGGFCYFNNLAVMIERIKRKFKLRRIFVLDIDAHHGNGSQDIFYGDSSVLYMSLHQHPFTLYPGTGLVGEIGLGEGEGYTVNAPMQPGSGDSEYAAVMQEVFMPLSEQFKPEMFAVSVGFDAHANDPLTGLQLSTKAYGWLANFVLKQAERWCGGKTVFLLEGGYDLDALSGGVTNIVKAMLGEKFPLPTEISPPDVIDEIKQALSNKWNL